MAASLIILTGQPNACTKSNATHPRPRLTGSADGRPFNTGPGYPSETASYAQSAASFFTLDAIRLGVSVGPDRKDRLSVCPVARIFTEVPPTSMTSTFLRLERRTAACLARDPGVPSALYCCAFAFSRLVPNIELTVIALSFELAAC